VRADIQSWMNDATIQDLIETEYKRGYYVGVGEFHLSGKAAATKLVKRTVDFAVERNLYLHAHADDEALEILFAHNPKARIIWAHTGFSTPADKVAAYLERYPDRFLLGSDTWIDQRWDSYGSIMADYRSWLAQLPQAVAEKIAFRNAEQLFKR